MFRRRGKNQPPIHNSLWYKNLTLNKDRIFLPPELEECKIDKRAREARDKNKKGKERNVETNTLEEKIEAARCPCNKEEHCLNKLWEMMDWYKYRLVTFDYGSVGIQTRDDPSQFVSSGTPTEAILKALVAQEGLTP